MEKCYDMVGFSDKMIVDFVENKLTINKYSANIQSIDRNIFYLPDKADGTKNAFLTFNNSCLYWEQDKPIFELQKDPTGSAVYVIPKYKMLFFKVPKNGCSSVISELYNNFYRKIGSPECTTSDWIFQNIFPKINYRHEFEIIKQQYVGLKEQFKDWKKFLVYDDPLKRVLRCMNHKYMKRLYFASIVKPQENIQKYIDEMLLAMQADNMNKVLHDTHLTSITNIWRDELEDMTYFVKLKDLDAFMFKQFGIQAKRYLVTKEEKPIKEETLSEQQITMIKDIFAEDYEILEKYADKFWSVNE